MTEAQILGECIEFVFGYAVTASVGHAWVRRHYGGLRAFLHGSEYRR